MTVILPFGRVLTRQVLPRSNHLLTRFASTNPLSRASCCEAGQTNDVESKNCNRRIRFGVLSYRSYATAAASKPVGRPKAHTGRTAAKKSSATTRSTASKKTPATKAKTTAKPKIRARAAPKPKKKAVRRPASKTAINKARVEKTRGVKAKALLDEPKGLPSNAWQLYFTQEKKGVKTANIAESAAGTKELAQNFKALSPEEHEKLNHTANQNKAKNEAEFKKWLSQFTPTEIREANAARRALNKEAKARGLKRSPIKMLRDARIVKQVKNAYTFFSMDRFASKDFRHMALAEAARLIGREWKNLSTSEKKTYEDQAQADLIRYREEYQTVYGKEPPASRTKKTSST